MNGIKDSLVLLRLPFSFLLMPVYLFGISQCQSPQWSQTIIMFVVIHLLVYPSSNAYNSYVDQDEGSIGGLANPPKATRQLFYLSVIMDIAALLIAGIMKPVLLYFVAGYILASRAYSSRQIRIKKFAVGSFLLVTFFQGGYMFALAQAAAGNLRLITNAFAFAGSSLLIAGIYPLTQIYQHEADAKSGDRTMSMVLGIKGTFRFCGVMFLLATIFIGLHFYYTGQFSRFYTYLLFLSPSAAFFMWWMKHASRFPQLADFKNTMLMSTISAVCMNLYFLLLIYFNLLR